MNFLNTKFIMIVMFFITLFFLNHVFTKQHFMDILKFLLHFITYVIYYFILARRFSFYNIDTITIMSSIFNRIIPSNKREKTFKPFGGGREGLLDLQL